MPPLGHHFCPQEPLHNAIKKSVREWMAADDVGNVDRFGNFKSAPKTVEELKVALAAAVKKHVLPRGAMHGYFDLRLTGRQAEAMWKEDDVALLVKANRQEQQRRGGLGSWGFDGVFGVCDDDA